MSNELTIQRLMDIAKTFRRDDNLLPDPDWHDVALTCSRQTLNYWLWSGGITPARDVAPNAQQTLIGIPVLIDHSMAMGAWKLERRNGR